MRPQKSSLAAGEGNRLIAVLGSVDPDRKVWVAGVCQHARFCPRRMTHETGTHRADAELALGPASNFDQAAASDGMNGFREPLRARAWRHDPWAW